VPCAAEDNAYRVNVSHIESKGIGYDQGYTTLEGFFTSKRGNYIPFADVRGHVFNNGKLASNLGIGTRYIINGNAMVGGNFYYDYRKTEHFHYNQIGIGFEAFLSRWEVRANGYLPVGQKQKTIDHRLNWISFKRFSGNQILINENYTDKIESAMRGFNLEVGAHPIDFMNSYDLYAGIGPYYLNAHDGQTTWGIKVRVKAEITKYVHVELSNSYDHLFNNRFQGTLTLSYPFGPKCCRNGKKPQIANEMHCRAVQPVERQEIIAVHKHKNTYTVDPIAIDPITQQPIHVVFVNNLNAGPTDGTFENPYVFLSHLDSNTMSAEVNSAPGNVIYVFSGNGSNSGMNQGQFIMKDSQRLLGSGNSHTFNTTKGLLTVPAQTSALPSIASVPRASGSVVVVGNNNEISGFNIQSNGTGGMATVGILDDLSVLSEPYRNLNVNNNNFTNGARAIFLSNMSENITIADNSSRSHVQSAVRITLNFPGANVLVQNNAITLESDAIHITNEGNYNVQIFNNTLSNLSGTGILLANINSIAPTTTFIAKGNVMSSLANGILADLDMHDGVFIFENNSISSATGSAVELTNNSTGTACARISGNSSSSAFIVNNADGGAIQLETGGNTVMTMGTITSVPPNTCSE
jgi:hypothetical protein